MKMFTVVLARPEYVDSDGQDYFIDHARGLSWSDAADEVQRKACIADGVEVESHEDYYPVAVFDGVHCSHV